MRIDERRSPHSGVFRTPDQHAGGLRSKGASWAAHRQHQEPILVVGISEERLQRFVSQYKDKSVFDHVVIGAGTEGDVAIDTISGATITVMVENATLMRSVRRVAESRGLSPPPPSAPAAVEATTASAKDKPAADNARRRHPPGKSAPPGHSCQALSSVSGRAKNIAAFRTNPSGKASGAKASSRSRCW
jgi:hypothetical protein